MVLTRKHLNKGRTLRKPKRISKPKTQNPAFKKYKIVRKRSAGRKGHPLIMMAKDKNKIVGFKMTSETNQPRSVKKLHQNPNPHDERPSYVYTKIEKAMQRELWLPNKMRDWKLSSKDKTKLSKFFKKKKRMTSSPRKNG